jgi:hypothetical protein
MRGVTSSLPLFGPFGLYVFWPFFGLSLFVSLGMVLAIVLLLVFLCCFLFDYSYTYLLQFTITKSLIAAEIGQCGGVMWVVTVVGVPTT